MPRFIKLNSQNQVMSVRYAEQIVEGEVESAEGECGQIMQLDGSFITPAIVFEPSEADYLLDLDYRLSMIELGL